MKRNTLLIMLCILLTVQAMAQSESKKEILTKEENQSIVNQELIDNSIQLIDIDEKMMLPDYKESRGSYDTTTLKLKLLPQYYGNSFIFPLHKKMFFYVDGEKRRYINLANYNLSYLALGWRFNNGLNVTGGMLAVKQFSSYLPYGINRFGVKLNINYSITNQLDFNMWGQYLTGSSLNSPVDVMLPQTGTGASMVLNLGGGSQLGVGADYQRDEKKERWNYNAGGKLKLNF